MVLSRAIVRDLHGREAAASVLGYITMAWVLVPMFAPALGGLLFGLGGYGPAFERDPAAVLEDVLDGIVSIESAERQYGVVIRDGTVDAAATAATRGA